MTRRQRRWGGGLAASVFLAAVGVFDGNGALLLAAVVPLAYVAADAAAGVSVPDSLSITRRIDPTPAPPDRPVAVSLTVRNDSERTVPDLRVVDGVPADLAVVDGTPRGGTSLAPGEELTLEYTVAARRGEYEFQQPQFRVRGFGAGAVETTRRVPDGDSRLVCRLDADAPPIDEHGDVRPGRLESDDAGAGVTFHSTREYYAGDPAERINWRHYAKRGDLATTNYERTVAATTILLIDARIRNRVVAGPGRPTAVELGTYAATHALTDLLRRGHDVGVVVLGLDGPGPAGLYWLPPAGNRQQRARALELFRAANDAAGRPPNESEQVRRVIELLPPGGQLVSFSPVLDDRAVEMVETWRAADVPVAVLSPDVVTENTVSGQYVQIRRRTRLARCQRVGARTVDWRRGTPLPTVLAEAFATDARLASTRLGGRTAGGDRR